MHLAPDAQRGAGGPSRVLVTGSLGRVGRALQPITGFELVPFDLPAGDVLDLVALRRAASGCDRILHLAWDRGEDFHTGERRPHNLTMTENVLNVAHELGVPRVILASSVHAGAAKRPKPWRRLDVSDTPHPTTPYGRSKVEMEALGRGAADAGLDVVVIRFGAVGQQRSAASPERARWLHPMDLQRLIEMALSSPVVPGRLQLMHGVSRNLGRQHRLRNELGWRPRLFPQLSRASYRSPPDELAPLIAESAELDLPSTPVRVQYVVGASPRSGSNLLCAHLRRRGCFGAPHELFPPRVLAAWRERAGEADLLAFMKSVRTTANGCFGVKVMAAHLPQWLAAESPSEVLATRFVLLTRRDLLGQSVSWVTADQTGAWTSRHRTGTTRWYDGSAVRRRLRDTAIEEATWRHFTATLGLPVLEVTYEELVEDAERVLSRIAAFLDVELPPPGDRAGIDLEQQRPSDRAWDRRFVEQARVEFLETGVPPEQLRELLRRPVDARAALRSAVARRLPPPLVSLARAVLPARHTGGPR